MDCTLVHLHGEVDSCYSAAEARPRSVARQNNSGLLRRCRSSSDFEGDRRQVPRRAADRNQPGCCNSAEAGRQYTEPARGQAVVVQLPILYRGMVSCLDDDGGVR